MKMFLLVLSLVATLNQPILLLNSGSDYKPKNFWDLGYDLNYIVDHFYMGVDKGLDVINDISNAVSNVLPSTTVQVTPTVKYYDNADNYFHNHTDYYEYKSYTNNYDNRSYATTYNYDNRTYTYNPIYNDYRTYDYRTYNSYNYFEDEDYYYITNNNITNYEYYIVNKIDVNDNRYYSYYYELPDGSESYNLTKEQVLGEFMSYDIYPYVQESDTADVLALFKLNGNYQNEVADSDIRLVYNGNSFVNGKFDGSLKLDGTVDMKMEGDFPNQYTVEFWFYNAINNGTYTGSGPAFAWHHSAYTYDNGTVRVWFNGVESTRGTRPCTAVNAVLPTVSRDTSYYDGKVLQGSREQWYNSWDDYGYVYNTAKLHGIDNGISAINSNRTISLSSTFGNKLPSTTVGNSSLPSHYVKYLTSPSYANTGVLTYPGSGYNAYYHNIDFTLGSKIDVNLTGAPSFNANDPLHYYPQFTQSKIDFGFTGNGNSSGYTIQNTNITGGYEWDDIVYLGTRGPYYVKASGYAKYAPTTVNNYVDMSQCLIDEIRVTNGILYTDSTFTYPQDEFTYGHIWVRPEGDDFNVGDIAVMSPVDITDYRIGGSDYSFPEAGNVYIGLVNGVGSYAKVYNGQNWIPCDFGVWSGTKWVDGKGFNFYTLSWDTPDNSVNIDIDINLDNVNVNEQDKQGFKNIISMIFSVFAFIPLCIGFLTVIPTPISIILVGLLGLITILIIIKIVKR